MPLPAIKTVPIVQKHHVWNKVALQKHVYHAILRATTQLGAQMCLKVIARVCQAYKALKENKRIKQGQPVPAINFNRSSVHFDKRIYSIKNNILSLYTLSGRIKIALNLAEHQKRILENGVAKEADLIARKIKGKTTWFLNLVIESTQPQPVAVDTVMGVDVGENNLAATTLGEVFGGGELRHRRDKYLSNRSRLQSNGSQSAKQKLRKISGKEQRRVKQTNHEVSKKIAEAAKTHAIGRIVMEDLTHIRARIKAGHRVRSRLHRWAFRQLQEYIAYKAQAFGIVIEYVNLAIPVKHARVVAN